MKNATCILVLVSLTALAGCADAPSRLDESHLDGHFGQDFEELDRATWELAEPGCEDESVTTLQLAACEGEPLLGALVSDDGDVVCVDSMSVLLEELGAPPNPVAADPSPQPSHPGPAQLAASEDMHIDTEPVRTQTTSGTYEDPTPTPVVNADPTPTPVRNPDFDPIPIPIVERDEEEDPTPTPVMEE